MLEIDDAATAEPRSDEVHEIGSVGRDAAVLHVHAPGPVLPRRADAVSRLWTRAVQGRGVGFPLSGGAGARASDGSTRVRSGVTG